jgi:hypothetical protein
MNSNNKVTFGDLSVWLKIIIVFGWVMFGLSIIVFLLGFMKGAVGA